MRVGDSQLFRIPCHIAVLHIVLHHQLVEIPENLFAFRNGRLLFRRDALVDDGDSLMDVCVKVRGDVVFDFVGEMLVYVDEELKILFHELHPFFLEREDRTSQGEVDGVEHRPRLAGLLDVFR